MIDSAVGLLVGGAVGTFFFGGLAWTLQQLPRSRRPALLLLASFALRTAVTLLGFAVLARTSWLAVAVGMVAFVAVRMLAVRFGTAQPDLFRDRGP